MPEITANAEVDRPRTYTNTLINVFNDAIEQFSSHQPEIGYSKASMFIEERQSLNGWLDRLQDTFKYWWGLSSSSDLFSEAYGLQFKKDEVVPNSQEARLDWILNQRLNDPLGSGEFKRVRIEFSSADTSSTDPQRVNDMRNYSVLKAFGILPIDSKDAYSVIEQIPKLNTNEGATMEQAYKICKDTGKPVSIDGFLGQNDPKRKENLRMYFGFTNPSLGIESAGFTSGKPGVGLLFEDSAIKRLANEFKVQAKRNEQVIKK